MKRTLLVLPLLLSACAISMGPPTTAAENLPVAIYDGNGTRIGTAVLTADSTGLTIALDVAGLAPGVHAVHIHEHGLCERPDFLSAGAHLDDGTHQHGRQNPAGPHLGDLEAITVGTDGRGTARLRFTPLSGRFQPKLIFGGDGTALIIHAGPDDQHTDPSGMSGPRIACGIMI